jgi:hypothetical protein
VTVAVRLAAAATAAAAAAASAAALAAGHTGLAFLPLGAVALVLLLGRPALLLGIFLGATVLCEIDPLGFLSFRTFFYEGRPSPSDLLFIAVLASVALDLVRNNRKLRLPHPFTLPLLLLVLALAAGVATGFANGGEHVAIINSLRVFAVIVLLPIAVVNIVRGRRDLWAFVVVGGGLCMVKGIEGIVSWLSGQGRPLGDTTLTFYAPAPNFVLLSFVLVVLAAIALRARLPWWAYVAAPVCLAAFVLSFRRNFWVAGVVGVVLLLLGSGFRGRRILVGAVLVLLVATRIAVSVTSVPDLESTVTERLTSISPTRIEAHPYDRYRLDEARNVIAEIEQNPVTGIGLGVPWEASHPLPVELEGGRLYTHVTFLWWWLKLGVLGALAYLLLLATAVTTALSLARRHPLVEVRAVALGLFAALLGLAVAETTGSFTGVSQPLTIIVAAIFGWLAAARRDLVTEAARAVQPAEPLAGLVARA